MGAKNKYFGTDGFRGEANCELSAVEAFKIGRFIGWYFGKEKKGNERAKIAIGKDTRRSSYMLEYSLASGIAASGSDAYMLHVITTPGVSYVTRTEGFDAGVMISASHNPFFDNGIKIVNRRGEKTSDELEGLIESHIDGKLQCADIKNGEIPLAKRGDIGKITDYIAGRNRYVGYLISLAGHSFKKLRIGIDTANGASFMIARSVFDALGAQTYTIGDEPDGININDGVGSTHPERLARLVKEEGLDIGFAFDGDADRCIAIDNLGSTVTGDGILYILGKRLKRLGMLPNNTVVTTVMSNGGLKKSFLPHKIKCAETSVGDKYVYECMQNEGYGLGGEESGHIILQKYATTGDGILTAIMLTEELLDSKSSFNELLRGFVALPKLTVNLRAANRDALLSDEGFVLLMEKAKKELKGGRVILRKSGTEPILRIMLEGDDKTVIEALASELSEYAKKKGYSE